MPPPPPPQIQFSKNPVGSIAQEIAGALLWEGLNAHGHADAATGITHREECRAHALDLKDRCMLATLAKALGQYDQSVKRSPMVPLRKSSDHYSGL